MLEWSPPRILAVIALAFSAILSSSRAPTFAKPYPQQILGYENIAGGYHEFNEGQSIEKVNSENAHSKNRRSPTEDVDNPTSYFPARKRHGIETPIRPLETESDGTSILNEGKMATLRSKVDQPERSNSVESSADDNDKISSNLRVSLSNSENQNKESGSLIGSTEGHSSPDNKPSQSQQTQQTAVRKSLEEKGDPDKNKEMKIQRRTDKQGAQDQDKADSNSQTQNNDQNTDNKGDANNNNVVGETATSENSITTSSEERGRIPSDKDSVDASPKVAGKVNSPEDTGGKSDNQGTSNKLAVPSEGSNSAQTTSDNDGSQTTSPEPIRDRLGTSGSEIVTTTHGPYEEGMPYYRDTQSKPTSSEPEVGHFQVDDKSADLEINANSAGVKVKAKPASLQVVSRPGSHSASSDAPLARSFYQHYHYPPFHRLHHWLPGFTGALRRHHLHRPYRFYPRDWFPARHRYDYDPDYAAAPLYRRRSWYPHRRRSRYHEPYMYERSRTEAPMRRSRYQYDEPWNLRYRRRFHGGRFHRTRSPLRHHLYDRYNIPVVNNFASPNMNVVPEADTLPQLPFNAQMTGQMMIPPAQRQDIVTPAPPPINLIGNPPASIMNGANFMGMNEMNNFGTMSSLNGFGATNDYSGMTGLNTLNGLNRMGGSPLDSMAGLNGEMGEEMANMEGAQGTRRHFETRVPESAGRPVKKAAIQSVRPTKDLKNDKNGQRNSVKGHLRFVSSKKSKLDLKGWEKIVKLHHDIKTQDKTHHRSRRTIKLVKRNEVQKPKHNIANLHAQNSKDEKGNRKNAIIIHRPPIVYHPPPEIYHRPAIVVHRAPIMLHRSPIIYHQPPVVVHRPAIIYHQPPIVFHQPPPVVNQPIMHSHDAYITKPVVYQTNSVVSHAHNYYGVPSQVYSGTFGCNGPHCAFRKGDVPRTGNNTGLTEAKATKAVKKEKRNVQSHFDFIASNEGAQELLTYISKEQRGRSKRNSLSNYYSFLRHKRQPRSTRILDNEIPKKKKKDVVVNRPPIIYHPPPEIYHRPDIVVHRPPLVIHRPPIIYHQPPVIVHRPAVVYHQPPIVFHQPPPAVSQPLLYSHDSFMIHPTVYASHHGSVVRDSGHYVGMPNVISNYGHPLFGMPHFPMGKRSLQEKKQNLSKTITTNENITPKSSSVKQTNREKIRHQPKNETSEKAGKKNSVVIARPPIIYHPPPEVYHRPVIVVHRAPIMLHRAPIIYHQPAVVVHRPAIVYHQPPLVFHQPPPVVNQPILKSHDTWIRRPVVVPYTSSISHHSTYVGVPDSFSTHLFGHYHGHFGHGHAFYKSKVARTSQPVEEQATPKNKIEKQSTPEKHHKNVKYSLKRRKSHNEKGGKKNAVIVKRPPVIYHPPPEIYHRPDIIIHRAPIMIHRAEIIYHQPPVIVHRPAVVYHQPPLIFHQPPPVVHQPFMKSHDTWVPKPTVTLYSSRVHHAGHTYQIPDAYYYHGHGAVHHLAYGKSKVPRKSKLAEENSDSRGIIKKRKQHRRKQDKDESGLEQSHTGRKKHATLKLSKVKTETGAKLHSDAKSNLKHHDYIFHKEKEKTESGAKKNAVIIHRPPIIYHPPPEVYHRPNIIVHRAPIVLYRAPIIYHQPPVVVHRPAIVYHQPPIVFHQPPPTVHQPILQSHDTWLTKTVTVPYSTHVHHVLTYHGVPHEEVYMHGLGSGAFVKSHVPPKTSRREKIQQHKSGNFDGTHESSGKASTASGEHARFRRTSRIVRAIRNPWGPFSEATVSPAEDTRSIGARYRIVRALDDLRTTPQGERTGLINKSNVSKNDILADPRRFEKGRNLKTSKRTILIIRRPPIIYHPPSHVIHRPSIVVHRQPLIVHRQPLLFHRPPILIRRPPIIIHRPPILFRRPPLLVHRPSLMIHRHPFIIHRTPFIMHHHPIMIHRPPIIIHKSPNFLVQHSSAIHHYPMHMVHVHCPGCGFGKSSILRVGNGNRTENPNDRRKKDQPRYHSHPNSYTISKHSNVPLIARPTSQLSNRPKPFVSDHDDETAGLKINKRKAVPGHQKKKDVVVNRPPIIYHPPPEVYHRPDIVVHRAPILIHRPPIVYHQPPVVVHRPAVVYHQPPIVFHQPSPAVNQPVLYSHDSFQVHPMAFASHMGSVINDAGHYIGLPHGGINNYPEPFRGPIPSALSPGLSRRAKVEKPKDYVKSSQGKSNKAKRKHANGEKKNKVIVARPPMIYHPPPEIYDRPNVIVHRPDLVFHRPAIVYHQPSVVIHRPPVIYRQPPVVFHQPAPMTSQPVVNTMDTYTAQPVFEPHATQMQQSSTYFGTPHFFPGYNNYGWQMNGNMLGWHGQSGSASGFPGWGYGPAFGRSKVEGATKKNKNGKNRNKSHGKGVNSGTHNKRSATNHNRRSHEHHHHHHHHHHHKDRHHDRDLDGKEFFGEKSTISHRGHHRSHVVIINRPPLVYQTPTQVIHPPPVLMALPPVVYHRPPLVFHQPPTVVHHPAIVYHQPAVVFHNSPPIIDSPVLHSANVINTRMHFASLPVSPYAHSTPTQYQYTPQNEYSPVVSGPAFSKSKVEKAPKMEAVKEAHTTERNKRNLKSRKPQRGHDIIGSKRQYMDLVVNRPPVVFHSPPDIFEKPSVVIPQAPIIVSRPPVLYHPPPLFVHKPPIIYHQAPLVLRHHTPSFHHHHSHHYHAIGLGYGKSTVLGKHNRIKKNPSDSENNETKKSRQSYSREGTRKNMLLVPRPPMIYHPPTEIYHKPDVVVHQPDVVIHRPSIVYHQPSVVVHRSSVAYHQPPVMFHQPVMLSHETYLAHPVPVPFVSQFHHVGTYIRAPRVYGDGPWNGAFLKSSVAKTRNDKENSSVSTSKRNKDRSRRSTSTHTSQQFNASAKADSTEKSNKKNKVIMLRPPMIYHPPSEIYDKPDIIVHRPDYVVHQPSVVYHQAPVVVHRPPVVYQQPPVVFHQPPPMVHQPIMNAHDTYVAHQVQVPYASQVQNTATYLGTPHFFPGGWNLGWGGSHSFAYGKSVVPKIAKENSNLRNAKTKLVKRDTRLNKAKNKKDKGHKKNRVIMHRPPLIYHPPPEIYHRPSIIVHRPDLVIHRPSIVFHQPSVVVHRPPVIYHQPPIVFHQPPPMVNQPMIHAHDTYLAHPDFEPYWSHSYHASTYVGAPHSFSGGWGWGYGHGDGFGFGHPFGKSKVEKAVSDRENTKQKKNISAGSRKKRSFVSKQRRPKHPRSHAALRKETIKGKAGHKKNLVVMRRPPLIYHPPPEIYHRPSVIVHRPDLVIHRPSIVFHQPPVVVHRPFVVYHQPPIVFHQPPPMVHQPLLHSHETYLAHPFFSPFLSHIDHAGTYVGAPHAFPGAWGWGHAFGKSKVAKSSTNHRNKVQKTIKSVGIQEKEQVKKRNQRSTKEPETNSLHKTVFPEASSSRPLNKKKRTKHTRDSIKHEKKASRKNLVIIRRPEMIYHPPAEIYDRPDIIVHRPDLVYHQPSIVYHQPSVVVNRPPITYNQSPVVFHQPPPMVNQPMVQQRDEYYAKPFLVPYMSQAHYKNAYAGAPPALAGGWGLGWNPGLGWSQWNGINKWGLGAWNNFNGNRWPFGFVPEQHQFGPTFAKSLIAKTSRTTKASKRTMSSKGSIKRKHWPRHHQDLHNTSKASTVAKEILTNGQKAGSHDALRKEIAKGRPGHKKNMVIMRRPALVYHPPAEVYHRPDVIVHRPDIVIHRPSVVFHQPSVVVHRPPVIYHQPPVVFHQPPPMVHQPILHSHETYMAHPDFQPFTSNIHHAGSYVGAPHFFHGGWGWGWGHGFGHAFGKSHVQRTEGTIKGQHTHKKNEITGQQKMHPKREKSENPAKKNSIVVSRPPIIYHPPPEIYHRPDIVVHRAPIVLHRPPIVYHQPPVVVHRPAVVYHQPPIIFHQPPPAIHQPILHSHDSFVVHPEAHFVPEGSTVSHAINYVGFPNSVMQQDELASHFHRSHIEHRKASEREGTKVPDESNKAIKSTISRNPITHKENTETAITDEAQKKTLRSHIGKTEKESKKRNTINTHSPFAPITPFNDVHPAGTTIEQHQKLSNIPGNNHDRQRDVAKRWAGATRRKRQAFVPAVGVGYHSPLPTMYKYSLAGLQSQAIPEALNHLPEDIATHPANVDYLTHATGPSYPNTPFFQSSLVSPYSPVTAKEDSPEVHVHVETTKSSIPFGRTKRQLMPVYSVPRLLGSSEHLLYSGIQPLDPLHNFHVAAQPENNHLVSPYQAMQMPAYNPYPSADEHRPRVSISVNSGRSRVPVAKRHVKQRSKRQLWGVRPPFASMFPLSPSQSYFPHSPYSLILASPYQTGALPSYAAGYGLYQSPYEAHNTLNPEERNVGYNALLSYLNAIYRAYLGYPPYYDHQRPKVRVDVHTSRSKIQKVKKKSSNSTSPASRSRITTLLRKRHPGNTEQSNRQLHNYGSLHPLPTEHESLPTKSKRSMEWGPRRGKSHLPHNNKRDELQDNTLIRNGESEAQDDQVPEQFVGGNSNAAMFNTEPSVNDRSEALPQLNNMALADQGPITQQDNVAPDVNRWQMPQGRRVFPAQRLPLQSLVNGVPVNPIPFTSPVAPYPAQEQQFQVMRAPFSIPFASFPTAVLPMQVSPAAQMPELSQLESEQNPAHTSVNVEVAKSSVPKKKNNHHATPTVHKTKAGINSAGHKLNTKRQKITLLNRLSAMQILPQTFKQNGVNMPSFNTIPINNYIGENEMISELPNKHGQSKRKHRIPGIKEIIYKTSTQSGINKTGKSQKRNEKTRTEVHHGKRSHHHPHKSGASHNNVKPEKRYKTGDKRQFDPTVTEPVSLLLPTGTQLPLWGVPQRSQHPHVSVKVEVSKRTSGVSKPKRNNHGTLRRQFIAPDQGIAPIKVQGAIENGLEESTASDQALPVLKNVPQQAESTQAFEGRPLQQLQQGQPIQLFQFDQDASQVPTMDPKQLQSFQQTPRFQQETKKPRVSINIETMKKTLPKKPKHSQPGRIITKRQMFGTVPLLSPVTQLDVHDRIQEQSRARSTINQSNQMHHKDKRQFTPTSVNTNAQRSLNTHVKFAKRQFIDYLVRPNLTPQLPARENNQKKAKRQLALMQLGDALERRGSPKPLGAILKKPPGNDRFLLNPNFNKPVEVFGTNPNIPGVPQEKPKFQDPPIMEDQFPFKGAAQPDGLPMPAEMSPNQMFQSPPDAIPFRQEPLEIGGSPKALSAGIAEPMMPPSPPEVKLLGMDSGGTGILRRGGLSQINPLLLAPRVLPISSVLPVPIPFDEHPQDTQSLPLPLEAPPSPVLPPPFLPFPPPETPDFHPQLLQDSPGAAGQETDAERPSVHVNVETSKSHIPNRGSHWKHKTSHPTKE